MILVCYINKDNNNNNNKRFNLIKLFGKTL